MEQTFSKEFALSSKIAKTPSGKYEWSITSKANNLELLEQNRDALIKSTKKKVKELIDNGEIKER